MQNLIQCAFWFILLGITPSCFSQNVGINTSGATPSSNAILDLNTGNTSRNLGFIIPHVSLQSLITFNPPIANANTTSDTGMVVYNTNASVGNGAGCYIWDGGQWVFSDGAPASYSNTITSAITGTTSTTAKMMGLAGSITPNKSGNVLIIISGTISNSKNANKSLVQLYTGTGTAPANGVAITGTARGTQETASIEATGAEEPFCVTAFVTSLTVGTVYWIDVAVASSATSGTASISNVTISAIEQ